jgi:hypothetical protein
VARLPNVRSRGCERESHEGEITWSQSAVLIILAQLRTLTLPSVPFQTRLWLKRNDIKVFNIYVITVYVSTTLAVFARVLRVRRHRDWGIARPCGIRSFRSKT